MNNQSQQQDKKLRQKETPNLPRYLKYERPVRNNNLSSFIEEHKRRVEEKLSSVKYNPDHEKKGEMPPKKWKDCRNEKKHKDCCKEIMEVLNGRRTDKKGGHKPKQSRQKKLACIAENMPRRDSVMPQLFHLLDRFFSRKKPENKFERHVFSRLVELEDKELDALYKGTGVFRDIKEPMRSRLFVPAYLDWSIEQETDPDMLYWEMMDEGMRLNGKEEGLNHIIRTGRVRPWPREINNIDNFEIITAPWPWINEVNGLRTATHRQAIDLYRPDEYQQTVNWAVNNSTGELSTSYEDTVSPFCEVSQHQDSKGICLRVAETRPGQSVTLTGFNYFSFNTRVLLTLLENGNPTTTFDLDCWAFGDTTTPVRDSANAVIADHRVKDIITFDIPEMTPDELYEFPPGIYQVVVKEPNDIGYTLPDGTQPTEFTSNYAYLKVLPKENLKYRIWSDEAHCYDPTDGEFGTDELHVRAYPVIFDTVSGYPQALPPRSIQWEGIDDGDDAPASWKWNILGEPGSPAQVNGIFGLGIIGWEVDSEDALDEAINSYDAAFTKFWNIVWIGVSGVAGGGIIAIALTAIFAKAAWWIALIIVIIVVLIILIVGLIWAAWAPPDRIILDMFIKSELDLYFLTNRNVPLPPVSNYTIIPQIDDFVLPDSKMGYLYREERRYSCPGEGSDYGIMFKYQRDI